MSLKRKSTEGAKVGLECYSKPDDEAGGGEEGPFLAVFPGITPPKSVPFDLYKPNNEETNKSKRKRRIVVADAGNVEFVGQNFGENSRQAFCRYVVAIRNKETDKVVFKDAPIITVNRTIKSLKKAGPHVSSRGQFLQAKNSLGEAFGTKRVKQHIKSVERNAVNVSTLENDAELLKDSISAKTRALPSKAEIKAEADEDRPIPPYNLNTTKVEEIYKMDHLIPSTEYQLIPVKSLLEKSSNPSTVLPFQGSTFINDSLKRVLSVSKKDRHKIRLLMYLSFLMAFRTIPDKGLNDPETVSRIMGGSETTPTVILDNFFERFTEVPQGNHLKKTKHTFTPKSKDKLLCWIFAIALTLENFNMDVTTLTAELWLKQTKVNEYFRSLGCKISDLTATQRAQMGISSDDHSKAHKRAILTAPLTFPAPKKRGPKAK